MLLAREAAKVFVVVVGWIALSPYASAQDFVHSSAPGELVARLAIRSGEVGGSDARTVTVYGDGRVRAHYPAYLKNGGTRETLLAPQELQTLVGALARSGLPELDQAQVQAQCASLERARGSVSRAVGGDVIEVELNLDQYRAPGSAQAVAVRKRVSWKGLRQDAASFPEVQALQGLAAARDALAALLTRQDLVNR